VQLEIGDERGKSNESLGMGLESPKSYIAVTSGPVEEDYKLVAKPEHTLIH
jgi:hypothetical protein